MRNFMQAYAAQLGFDSHHVLWLHINLPEKSFPGWQERVNYYDALIEKIQTTPGVTSAAISGVGYPLTYQQLAPAGTNHRQHS